jgi:hypothetical protein
LVALLFSNLISARTVTSVIDSPAIVIGSPIQLKFQAPNGFEPKNWPEEGLNGVEALGGFKKENDVWKILITAYDSGFYEIKNYPFYNDNSDSIFAEPVKFVADYPTSLKKNPDTIQPEKMNWEEPAFWSDYLLWFLIGGGVLLVIVIGVLAYFYVKKKKEVVIVIPPKVIPADETALDRLAKLQASELWQKGEIKSYYIELSHIVREYLEKRYHFPALESTSPQILALMKKEWTNSQLLDKLDFMLNGADLVKFAKSSPTSNIHEGAMDDAILMIQETKEIIEN